MSIKELLDGQEYVLLREVTPTGEVHRGYRNVAMRVFKSNPKKMKKERVQINRIRVKIGGPPVMVRARRGFDGTIVVEFTEVE